MMRAFTTASVVLVGALLAGLVLGLGDGLGALDVAFLLEDARDAGRAGGIAPMIVATLGVLAVGLGVAAPVGILSAAWLSEYAGRGAAPVRAALDVLAAIPSVVFGLFGMALFCELLGLGWSLLAGGLTVAVMILPLFVRLVEEGLRAVPDSLRAAGEALGLPRWRVLLRVILPQALPSVAAAAVLATGRVLAESAALMFTAGTAMRMPAGLDAPGRVLAYHVYALAVDVPGGSGRAAAVGLVLVVLVVISTTLAAAAPRVLKW